MPDTDLTLIPTDELLRELATRGACTLVCCVRKAADNSVTDHEEVWIDWRGSNITALGLAARAHTKINAQLQQEFEDDA